METNLEQNKQAKVEEEYVLLDLDDVCVKADIPPNASYVLSDLDTLNPVLVIGDRLKLVGEYQETMGTCYLFSETDGETTMLHPEMGPSERNLFKDMLHPEMGPSERNLFKDKSIVDPNPDPSKQVRPITGLNRVLKFRLATEDEAKTWMRSTTTDL